MAREADKNVCSFRVDKTDPATKARNHPTHLEKHNIEQNVSGVIAQTDSNTKGR